MAPLTEGEREHEGRARYGGVAPRGGRLHSAPRQPPAQRTVETQLLKPREPDVQACKRLCRTPFACEAEAQQARATGAPAWQATFLAPSTVRARPRDAKRGRPGQGAPPAPVVDHMDATWASSRAVRPARLAPPSCCRRATHELDDTR
jgi:hypothetical protein